MKKCFCLFLVLLGAATVVRAGSAAERASFVTRVETCEAILREFQARPATAIPPQILQNAKAIVIVNQIQGGAVFGFKDGYGAILVKRRSGNWSIPVIVRAGQLSIGLQLGGSRVETVYVLMDERTPRLLFEGRMNIGVDAAAVAGPHASDVEKTSKEILAVPVQVYSNQKGLFAGATVKTGYISRNDAINRAYYPGDFDLPELLYGEWTPVTEEVQPLVQFVTQITK